eukprot:snap_masked-scaffold_2-processed-gene-16.6-mRNA-1 protein AED:1.00 eAED:1.00 QI:0/-1/0/0/-1/1/1/0/304
MPKIVYILQQYFSVGNRMSLKRYVRKTLHLTTQRHFSKNIKTFNSSTGVENVNEIFILPSCFEPSSSWDYIAKKLSRQSFTTNVINIDYKENESLTNLLEYIENLKIPQHSILITSYLSSFLGFKYLESFATSGLVLINPISMGGSSLLKDVSTLTNLNLDKNPTEKLQSKYGYKGIFKSLLGRNQTAQVTLDVENLSAEISRNLSSINAPLLVDVIDSANRVNVEPHTVNMLQIYFEGFREKENERISTFHGLEEGAELIKVNTGKQKELNYDKIFPMFQDGISIQTQDRLVQEIVNWNGTYF